MGKKATKILKIIIGFIITYFLIFFTNLNPLSCKVIGENQIFGWFGVSVFCSFISFGQDILKNTSIDPWSDTVGYRSEYRRKIAFARFTSPKFWILNLLINIAIAFLVFSAILAINYVNSLGCKV